MRSRRAEGGEAEAAAAFTFVKESPDKKAAEWEVRPCGMLVQKRDSDADASGADPVPTVRLKVKYGVASHEIYISSQATFGELKKVLSSRTGLHPLDMKLVYKDKERDSSAFLDIAGVKDKSKVLLLEDPTAQAKRLLEMRRTKKMEKAAKSISDISLEVDRLASKVSALDTILSKGGRVVENDVANLIELMMNELVKLDSIIAEDDAAKLQRRLLIKRVQKYVETLDMIKIKNAKAQQQNHQPQHQVQPQNQQQMHQNGNSQQQQQQQQQQHPIQTHYQQQLQQKKVVVTTNWETFDSLFMPSTSAAAATAVTSIATPAPHPRFDWELF